MGIEKELSPVNQMACLLIFFSLKSTQFFQLDSKSMGVLNMQVFLVKPVVNYFLSLHDFSIELTSLQ